MVIFFGRKLNWLSDIPKSMTINKHLQAIEKDNILGGSTFGTGVKGDINAKMFVSSPFI